jgi:hypothetical protein
VQSGGPVPDLRYASPRGYGGKGCQPYYATEGRQRHVWHHFRRQPHYMPAQIGRARLGASLQGATPQFGHKPSTVPGHSKPTFALFAGVSRWCVSPLPRPSLAAGCTITLK